MTGPIDRLDAFLAQPVGTRSIGVVRILVGAITVAHLTPIARSAMKGATYHDRFHEPFLDDLVPALGPVAFTVLMVVGTVAALAMTVGASTRVATAVATTAVGAHLAASTTHLHNHRAYLFAVLVGLSLAPAGRSWSIDRMVRRRRGRPALDESMPAWPLWLLRFECALVYGASGFSKLIDPDWFGGTVTWGRVVAGEAMLRASILPSVVQDVLLDRSFHTVAAKFVVLTELAIATGLWWRPTRRWAVAVAVAFHLMIEASAAVRSFSVLGISVLFVWADPGLRPGRGWPRHLPKVPAWGRSDDD
jgi:hypothetical protein